MTQTCNFYAQYISSCDVKFRLVALKCLRDTFGQMRDADRMLKTGVLRSSENIIARSQLLQMRETLELLSVYDCNTECIHLHC